MVAALAALLSCLALAGDRDYFLSVPDLGAVWKVDASTLQGQPIATGLIIPDYGTFLPDGTLILPDRGYSSVLRLTQGGATAALSAGGLFDAPVTVVRAPAGDGVVVSDIFASRIVHVGWDGTQTLLHDKASTNGLLDWPGGLAFDGDGNLFVGNVLSDSILRIDPAGHAEVFSMSPLIDQPGGLAIDGSGNLFATMYGFNTVVRFRLDTGEAEVFAADLGKMSHPSDLKLARSGGLLATTRQSNLVRIDAEGHIDVVFHDQNLGEILGIAVPEDATPCSGTFAKYGAGTPGTGGVVPELRAIFSPCPGESAAIEMRGMKPSAAAWWFIGFAQAQLPLKGGTLLVDPNALFIVPFAVPASGELVLQFTVPDDAALTGLKIEHQVLVADPGVSKGIAFSNGLEERIGS